MKQKTKLKKGKLKEKFAVSVTDLELHSDDTFHFQTGLDICCNSVSTQLMFSVSAGVPRPGHGQIGGAQTSPARGSRPA